MTRDTVTIVHNIFPQVKFFNCWSSEFFRSLFRGEVLQQVLLLFFEQYLEGGKNWQTKLEEAAYLRDTECVQIGGKRGFLLL